MHPGEVGSRQYCRPTKPHTTQHIIHPISYPAICRVPWLHHYHQTSAEDLPQIRSNDSGISTFQTQRSEIRDQRSEIRDQMTETDKQKDGKPKQRGNDDEEVPQMRPRRFGSACPPEYPPSDFQGRGGAWHCENCDKATMLEDKTKQWKCSRCGKTMFTMPADECPLDTFCPCCCWDAILTKH
jgi:hypothetical protein